MINVIRKMINERKNETWMQKHQFLELEIKFKPFLVRKG